eukprot:10294532-Ditylum_brightwellii.AAC.1
MGPVNILSNKDCRTLPFQTNISKAAGATSDCVVVGSNVRLGNGVGDKAGGGLAAFVGFNFFSGIEGCAPLFADGE